MADPSFPRFIAVEFINQEKSLDNFRLEIRRAIRGLWSEALSLFDFIDSMRVTIEVGYRQAWLEGARQCGIVSLDELTVDEVQELQRLTIEQFQYLPGFAQDIRAGSKFRGGKLQPLFERSERWVYQYEKIKSIAHAMSCKDEKQEFVLGPTEKHCRSCSGLNGRVYRNSVWVANNAVPPRNPNFECGGASFCQCSLRSTDKPITPGPFPTRLLK